MRKKKLKDAEFERNINRSIGGLIRETEEDSNMYDSDSSGKSRKGLKIFGTLGGALIFCGIGAYLGMSYYYSDKFFPGTTINSFDCSDMTAAECEEKIRQKVEDYSLTVYAKDFEPETISAEKLGYQYQSDGEIEKALEQQNPLTWIKGYLVKSQYSTGENVVYSKKKVKKQLKKLQCMQPENQVQPQDAYIEFQDTLFAIVPGSEGTAIDTKKAVNLVCSAIDSAEKEVNFESGGVYLQPSVREDDKSLIERLKILNTYAKASVTHTFGDTNEVLEGVTIKDWYTRDPDGNLYLDGEVLKERLRTYVANMAVKYDTVGKTRTFHATSGRTVEVSGGNYGWKINQSAEVDKMYEEILTGQQVVREPIYSSYGSTWVNGSDIGNTYIEVDISAQHMYFYKNGSVILDSEFVSGSMVSDDRKTPSGVCDLTFKKRDFTLRGDKKPDGTYEYEEPVKYWMPFNGGVGFHDAPWRGEFGGDIYKTNGSHGCINMPSDKAAQLYDLIDDGIPIVVFY